MLCLICRKVSLSRIGTKKLTFVGTSAVVPTPPSSASMSFKRHVHTFPSLQYLYRFRNHLTTMAWWFIHQIHPRHNTDTQVINTKCGSVLLFAATWNLINYFFLCFQWRFLDQLSQPWYFDQRCQQCFLEQGPEQKLRQGKEVTEAEVSLWESVFHPSPRS